MIDVTLKETLHDLGKKMTPEQHFLFQNTFNTLNTSTATLGDYFAKHHQTGL